MIVSAPSEIRWVRENVIPLTPTTVVVGVAKALAGLSMASGLWAPPVNPQQSSIAC